MRNKKRFDKKGEGGLLEEETLKIIIAVICITFLVILVVVVYYASTGNQKVNQVREIVNGEHGITQEIDRIYSGGVGNDSFFVPNPSGWHILSFVGNDVKPDMCAGINCLCICEELTIGIINVDARQAGRCDDTGACIVIQNLKKTDPIEIKNGGIFISINSINGEIQVTKK